MYVTVKQSLLKRSPNFVSDQPEGPNLGYLVIKDEESESYSCFGLCKRHSLKDLPFPHNKDLTILYSASGGPNAAGTGDNMIHYRDEIIFIPVLNQPLSSNRYHAIKPHRSHKGEAYVCSTDQDMATCCFCHCISDKKPRPFNPQDIHQQYEIHPEKKLLTPKGSFYVKPVAPHSHPPKILRRKGWEISAKSPKIFELSEAKGVNTSLRAQLPRFDFPIDSNSESVVIGNWYCPFVFIKDGNLKDQAKKTRYYKMTLGQRWEKIFAHENLNGSEGKKVTVDVATQKEVVCVNGKEAVWDDLEVVYGVVWFKSHRNRGEDIGLRVEIVERMKWEEERGGWVRSNGRVMKLRKTEKFGGMWRKFGCYVLVERFVLKRMDNSVVLTYDFRHFHQLRCKWE